MAIQQGWMEQRQFERISATMKVSYRIVGKEELVQSMGNSAYNESTADKLPELAKKSTVFHAVTRDISLGGMSIVGYEPVSLGTAVAVMLAVPNTPTPVTLMAEVVQVSKESGMKGITYRAGLKILAINREDVVRIEKHLLIEKLKQESSKRKG